MAKETLMSDNKTFDYDIIVIGGGPGGYVAALRGANKGKRVALVERDSLGGTCLNCGCIPTKVFMRSAQMLSFVKKAGEYGIIADSLKEAKLDMKLVQKRKARAIRQLNRGVQGMLDEAGVTIVKGRGFLPSPHVVMVEREGQTENLTGEYIIIATGSSSKSIPLEVEEGIEVLYSDMFLDVEEIPEKVLIVGGGVIGIEFAYFLASIGTKVIVAEMMDRILPMIDEELSQMLMRDLKSLGVEFRLGNSVGKVKREEADLVLLVVGRDPLIETINCKELGLATERGAILTDEYLQTSLEKIYAIGDVNGKSMLAHTASMEAIVAIDNICEEWEKAKSKGGKYKARKKGMNYENIPSGIYTQPEVAGVGLSELEAIERLGAEKISVSRVPMAANGKAKVEGDERGMIKVVAERGSGKILGAHIYGIHATDLIGEIALAMNSGLTAEALAMSVHPHPTISELIPEVMALVETE